MRRRKKTWLIYGSLLILLIVVFWPQKLDDNILELSTCPACYGQGLCPAMIEDEYTGNTKINLVGFSKWKISKLMNVKNVYYGQSDVKNVENIYSSLNNVENHYNGQSNSVPVVLKKLAHDSELYEFNTKLCKANKEDENCDVSQAIKSLLTKNNLNIAQVVNRYPHLFETSEGVKCNHNKTFYHLYDNYIKIDSGPYQEHHFITMLAVNMEPLLLNAYQNSWFPTLYGMCGRMMVEEYVGPTLTELAYIPWHHRANYARQLIEMAQDFSSGQFHLYMTDVSLDNFAVDNSGKVKLIDVENIVLMDPNIDGLDPSEHINEGFGCRDCLSFSYEDLCGHVLADHNFFAVCKGMLSSHAFSRDIPSGLLHDPPDWVKEEYPKLLSLVEECGRPEHHSTVSHRRNAASDLHAQLTQLLHKLGKL